MLSLVSEQKIIVIVFLIKLDNAHFTLSFVVYHQNDMKYHSIELQMDDLILLNSAENHDIYRPILFDKIVIYTQGKLAIKFHGTFIRNLV